MGEFAVGIRRLLLNFVETRCSGLLGALLLAVLALCGQNMSAAPSWSTVGPAGGDARALTAAPGDPNHLYLGTTNSWLYESTDGGATWSRLARMAHTDGLV